MLYIIGPLTSSKLEANSSNPCMCIFILPRQISNFWSPPPPCGKGWTYQLWQWLMNLCNMVFLSVQQRKRRLPDALPHFYCTLSYLTGDLVSLWILLGFLLCVCVEWDLGVGFKLKSWAQSNLDPAFLLYCFLSQFEFPIFAASAFFFFQFCFKIVSITFPAIINSNFCNALKWILK